MINTLSEAIGEGILLHVSLRVSVRGLPERYRRIYKLFWLSIDHQSPLSQSSQLYEKQQEPQQQTNMVKVYFIAAFLLVAAATVMAAPVGK